MEAAPPPSDPLGPAMSCMHMAARLNTERSFALLGSRESGKDLWIPFECGSLSTSIRTSGLPPRCIPCFVVTAIFLDWNIFAVIYQQPSQQRVGSIFRRQQPWKLPAGMRRILSLRFHMCIVCVPMDSMMMMMMMMHNPTHWCVTSSASDTRCSTSVHIYALVRADVKSALIVTCPSFSGRALGGHLA